MSKPKSILIRTAVIIAMLFTAYIALLGFPQPLFAYSISADNLTLHSDKLLPKESAEHVLQLAVAKLATSPLYSANQTYDIFVCNARWRQRLFFSTNYGVGGVAPYPFTQNVFLRDSNITDNQLISPLGTPILGTRTLDYFIAHELTHQLTGHAIGPVRYLQLPPYVREGYADYVGKGNSFHYEAARQAFLANAPDMDYQKSGLYLRYNLLVTHLLDHRHMSVSNLLRNPPPQEAVEAAIRNADSH